MFCQDRQKKIVSYRIVTSWTDVSSCEHKWCLDVAWNDESKLHEIPLVAPCKHTFRTQRDYSLKSYLILIWWIVYRFIWKKPLSLENNRKIDSTSISESNFSNWKSAISLTDYRRRRKIVYLSTSHNWN